MKPAFATAIESVTPREIERFWAMVEQGDGCWPWRGSKRTNGYGQFNFRGRPINAHRFAYAASVGAIAEGLVIDHLCRNIVCVNPAHLEAVTHRENVRRGKSGALADTAWHDEVFALWREHDEISALEIARRLGRSHSHVAALLRRQPKRYFQRTCDECGQGFQAERAIARFCGRTCRNAWHGARRADRKQVAA